MVDKGYVKKEISPNSDSEVCLTLTDSGKTAYQGHIDCRQNSGYDFFKELEDMPKGYEEFTIKILKKYNDILDDHIKK